MIKKNDLNKIPTNRKNNLNKIQSVIKIKFKNIFLLNLALMHRSYSNEVHSENYDNERLEYLGDSVLALIVNEYLYKRFNTYHEGELAKIKSAVVSEDMLASVANDLNIGKFILLGKGEENSGGRNRKSIVANTLEAIIGAIYLDSGLKVVKKFVLSQFKKHIELVDKLPSLRDPKTALQEIVQKKYKEKPVYKIFKEAGPDHNKSFTISLYINNKLIAKGKGPSKRKAEMEAARTTLKMIYSGEVEV